MKYCSFSQKENKGFTLIELSVVVALIALAALIVGPRFTGVLSGRRLLGAAGRLAGALDYTRSRAVLEGRICYFHFNRNKNQYWITTEAGKSDSSSPKGGRQTLPRGISVRRIEKKGGGRNRFSPVIRFYPRGTADETVIYLKDRPGQQVKVHVKPYTGRSEVIRSRY